MEGGRRGRNLEKGKEVAVHDAQQSRRGNQHPYPKPMAKYQEVLADPELFMKTLDRLHNMMGTKFKIPKIGGRDLDLHRLFFEVTSRGGIEKLIAEKRWREVTAVFYFPSTATNASFILHKYYLSLLYHYEQIYLFGSQGWSSPGPSNTLSLNSFPSDRLLELVTPCTGTQIALRKRGRSNVESSSACPRVDGIIDGRFEHGYFVTVTVGSAKLRGVRYHFPGNPVVQVPQYLRIGDDDDQRNTGPQRCTKLSKRVPTRPKPIRSGYSFFFAEQYARLEPDHTGKDREISKMIGDLWSRLTETEKVVYQERGLQDQERHQREITAYKGLNVGQIITNAVPIRHCPGELMILHALPKHPTVDVDLTNVASSSDDDDDHASPKRPIVDVDLINLVSSSDDDDKTVSDCDDSEDEISHGDSEVDTSLVVGGNGTPSNDLAGQLSEGDCFSGKLENNPSNYMKIWKADPK